MKIKNYVICTKCGSRNTKKHGIRNGIQRFYCHDCKKTFTEETFTKREKKLLLMFEKLINADYDKGMSINQAIKDINIKDSVDTEKFHILQKASKQKGHLFCYNPCLLICQDSNHIILHYIEKRLPEDGASRKIEIIDHDNYRRYYTS